MRNFLILSLLLQFFFFLFPFSASAQTVADKSVLDHARKVAQACPGQWEDHACSVTVSQAAKYMVIKYAEDLDKRGLKNAVEYLKDHCAASTVIDQTDVPAYAVKSAFTECANGIVDIANEAKVKPDPSYMELFGGAIWCMENKQPVCGEIERQLMAKYR
ncbi:MAG: hypothetical protein K9G62_01305 [Alphaproteobacteria bacterium]|nr:hypothetical protein [Alphaproteobacteria bacterium]